MKCPFRTKTIKINTDNEHGVYYKTEISEEFEECYLDECPYYIAAKNSDNATHLSTCQKVVN